MRPHEFLDLAEELTEHDTAAANRSAISRSYYAVFNAAEEFLQRMGFGSRKRDYHVGLQTRLLVCGDSEFVKIGSDLGGFHRKRIEADYKMAEKTPENRKNAQAAVDDARRMIESLENCAIYGERWKRIKNAIQRLE